MYVYTMSYIHWLQNENLLVDKRHIILFAKREVLNIDECETNDRVLIYSDNKKCIYLLANETIVKYSVKTCFEKLYMRGKLIYNR
jgi:hypothetical protein